MSELVPIGHGPQAQIHSESELEVQVEPEVHKQYKTKSAATYTK